MPWNHDPPALLAVSQDHVLSTLPLENVTDALERRD
jgi:hypothetical protein